LTGVSTVKGSTPAELSRFFFLLLLLLLFTVALFLVFQRLGKTRLFSMFSRFLKFFFPTVLSEKKEEKQNQTKTKR